MSDIFISYARHRGLGTSGEALRAPRYGVWLDDELPAHRAYTTKVMEDRCSAKAVVVIWSAEAANSDWVRSEANE